MAEAKKQKVTKSKQDESRHNRHKQKQNEPKVSKKPVEVQQSRSKTSDSQQSKSQQSKLALEKKLPAICYGASKKRKTSGGRKKVEKHYPKQLELQKKKKEKRREKGTSVKSQASSQTTQKLLKASKERIKRESRKEEKMKEKSRRHEKREKDKKQDKERGDMEKPKPRKCDHVDLTIPTDSSPKAKPTRRSQLLAPKPSAIVSAPLTVPTPPSAAAQPVTDWPKQHSDVAVQPPVFNLNEVLRIGGVLGRYGMDKKRREAFDWLASHPLEVAEGSAEAVYNVRMAVGDLPMSRLLVSQVLRLLVDRGEVTRKEYQRHFSTLEKNIVDQAITISQFAYFINMHCEKYKHRPIVTYNNSSNSNK